MNRYNRVCLYLDLGYSAERVSDLIGWPLSKVIQMKESGEFVPTTRRDRAIHLVLSGCTIPDAARAVNLPLRQVENAVEDARTKIDQLVSAQYPHDKITQRL